VFFNDILKETDGEFNVKSIPLKALTAPEGSRRFRLPDFKTLGT
jgi:hypothetical protein